MSPPNLKLWSISRKEDLETQQKPALRNKSLRSLLCSNDRVQSEHANEEKNFHS